MKYATVTSSVLAGMALALSIALHAEPRLHYTIGGSAGRDIPAKFVLLPVEFVVSEISAGG